MSWQDVALAYDGKMSPDSPQDVTAATCHGKMSQQPVATARHGKTPRQDLIAG